MKNSAYFPLRMLKMCPGIPPWSLILAEAAIVVSGHHEINGREEVDRQIEN